MSFLLAPAATLAEALGAGELGLELAGAVDNISNVSMFGPYQPADEDQWEEALRRGYDNPNQMYKADSKAAKKGTLDLKNVLIADPSEAQHAN